jgi:hypothetical protein
VLKLDGAFDAFLAKSMLTGGDNWVVKFFKTDGTFVVIVNAELKEHLKSSFILFGESHSFVVVEESKHVIDPVTAKLPVAAELTKPKEDFEKMPVSIDTFDLFSFFVCFC